MLVLTTLLTAAASAPATVLVESGGRIDIAASGTLQVGVGGAAPPAMPASCPAPPVMRLLGGEWGGPVGNYIEEGDMTNSTDGSCALPSFFFEDVDVRRNAAKAADPQLTAEVDRGTAALAERPRPVLFG